MPQASPLAGDMLAQLHPDRCRVCLLPLPRGGDPQGICSRRCAGRHKESAELASRRDALKTAILSALSTLSKDASICPGELSHRVLPGTSQPLSILRPLLFELAEDGRVRLSQKGTLLPWWKIRGPFRVKPR